MASYAKSIFGDGFRTPADQRNLQELETIRQSFIQIAEMLDSQIE
jgi:hypothetical protein